MSPTRSRPSVRTRRTALVLDDHGAARVGGLPGFDSAVTDFADLARDPEPFVLGGHLYTAPGLVATVVRELLDTDEPSTGSVVTYPAVYSDKQVALLRQALDLAGMREVIMVPEPVAAAEWLEYEHGPLEPGFALVYDLGGASLDVTVVRVGPDWSDHPIVGNPRRCYDFGGRPLGATIARYSRGTAPGVIPLTALVDVDSLRADHIRDSFDVVRSCLNSTGRSLSDIGRILVVGAASRPPEVASTLAELGRPVITSADPGQIVATGAACFAARSFAHADDASRITRGAVFSGAAVASALAVSAATMLGGNTDPALEPMLQRYPDLAQPSDVRTHPRTDSAHTAQVDGDVRHGIPLGLTEPVAGLTRNANGRFVSTSRRVLGPTIAESRGDRHSDPRARALPLEEESDPARFIHLLPFGWTTDAGWDRPILSVPGRAFALAAPVPVQVGESPAGFPIGAPAAPGGAGALAGDGGWGSAPAPVGDGTSGPAVDQGTPGDGGTSGAAAGSDSGPDIGGSGPSGAEGSGGVPAGGDDSIDGGLPGGGDSSGGDLSGGVSSGGGTSGGAWSGGGDSVGGGASPGADGSTGGSAGSGSGSGDDGTYSGGGNSGGGHSDSGGASNGGGSGGFGGGSGGASGGGPSGVGSAGPSRSGSGKLSGGEGSGNDKSGSSRSGDGGGSSHGGSGHGGSGRGGGKGGGGSRFGGGDGGRDDGTGGNGGGGGNRGGGSRGR